jgi:glutamyl-tRNA synthetase
MDTPDKKQNKVVTRFAPSPTGFMHVGNLRTGLYAWLLARKNDGVFILRIEDTDKKREVEGSMEHIKKSLRWIGMDWDQGPDVGGQYAPYIQSERLEIYKKYGEKLIEKGFAYADPYTAEEIEAFRKKADEEKRGYLYRDHRPENPPVWDGTQPLRLRVPELKRYEWHDAVWGELSAGPEALDDFILIKSDGYPTYNFAHIVDDIEMGITHVMRGQEFIASTPKYLSVYEALGEVPPIFATTPPIMGDSGNKKLGKRDGAKDVLEYAREGYLPETMMNFLALIGWNPGGEQEVFSKAELTSLFSLEHMQKAGGAFNEDKLDWMNREYLKKMSYEEQEEYIVKFLPESITSLPGYSNTIVHNITPVIMERISKGKDVTDMAEAGEFDYYFDKPKYSNEALFFKSSKIPTDIRETTLTQYLNHVIGILGMIALSDFNKEVVKEKVWPYTESGEVASRGDVLWPMRFALSGREKSPDPFTLAEILGKEETIARLQAAIEVLSR